MSDFIIEILITVLSISITIFSFKVNVDNLNITYIQNKIIVKQYNSSSDTEINRNYVFFFGLLLFFVSYLIDQYKTTAYIIIVAFLTFLTLLNVIIIKKINLKFSSYLRFIIFFSYFSPLITLLICFNLDYIVTGSDFLIKSVNTAFRMVMNTLALILLLLPEYKILKGIIKKRYISKSIIILTLFVSILFYLIVSGNLYSFIENYPIPNFNI